MSSRINDSYKIYFVYLKGNRSIIRDILSKHRLAILEEEYNGESIISLSYSAAEPIMYDMPVLKACALGECDGNVYVLYSDSGSTAFGASTYIGKSEWGSKKGDYAYWLRPDKNKDFAVYYKNGADLIHYVFPYAEDWSNGSYTGCNAN